VPTIPSRSQEITEDFLIVGEGEGDSAFFRHLLANRGIAGFQAEDAGGSGNFRNHLQGLNIRSGINRLRALIVVGDNEETPDDCFKRIRSHLKKADLPVPNNPLELAPRTTGFPVAVMMIPFDKARGALESLLLKAATDHLVVPARCVGNYCQCINTSTWPKTASDKMRLRCMIAAAWPEDPNIGLQWALSPDRKLIPLNHPCFDEVAQWLSDFPSLL